MKIRSVTIGDVLIVLLIAGSNWDHKSRPSYDSDASATKHFTTPATPSALAGSLYQLKNRSQVKNQMPETKNFH